MKKPDFCRAIQLILQSHCIDLEFEALIGIRIARVTCGIGFGSHVAIGARIHKTIECRFVIGELNRPEIPPSARRPAFVCFAS